MIDIIGIIIFLFWAYIIMVVIGFIVWLLQDSLEDLTNEELNKRSDLIDSMTIEPNDPIGLIYE